MGRNCRRFCVGNLEDQGVVTKRIEVAADFPMVAELLNVGIVRLR
jgi:hypothetical protein